MAAWPDDQEIAMNRRQFCLQLLSGAAATTIAAGARGQTGYPNRAIHLVVPFAPGGSNDIIARIIGDQLSQALKVPVVVENKGGAGGMIGTDYVIKSAPDGYTLMIGATSTMAANPSLYASKKFDPTHDLSAIMQIATGPFVLAVPSSLPVKSVQDLIDLAKQKPGKIYFGSSGTGSSLQLTAELFKSMAKIDIVHVPYRGLGPALIDLVADRIQIVFSDMAGLLPYVQSGKLRALAVTSSQRWRDLPELPTMSEAGVPGYDATSWYGILGPANLPKDIVSSLNKVLQTILTNPDTVKKFATLGVEPVTGSPSDFEAYMTAEIKKWGQVVSAANIKLE
jgi:tripartite-type tricarboxylate transporter receptor subunit TctC